MYRIFPLGLPVRVSISEPRRLGDAEVQHLDLAVEQHEHVVRRDVAVHEVQRRSVVVAQLVRGVQTRQRLREHAQMQWQRRLLGRAHQHRRQRLPLEVLHDDARAPFVLTDLEDVDDVGVRQTRRDARFFQEHLQELGLAQQLAPHDLEDEQLGEALRSPRHREVNHAHPAFPKLHEELVLGAIRPSTACSWLLPCGQIRIALRIIGGLRAISEAQTGESQVGPRRAHNKRLAPTCAYAGIHLSLFACVDARMVLCPRWTNAFTPLVPGESIDATAYEESG